MKEMNSAITLFSLITGPAFESAQLRVNKFRRRLEFINTNVETARNDLLISMIPFAGNM